jgi:hypothetical protein
MALPAPAEEAVVRFVRRDALAQLMDINYVATAPVGARLVAEATEEGKLIAACHGMVYRRHEHFTEGA